MIAVASHSQRRIVHTKRKHAEYVRRLEFSFFHFSSVFPFVRGAFPFFYLLISVEST